MVASRREILVTIILLALIAGISYLILYTDPAKTRAYINSIPAKVEEWYKKHIVRK